MNFKKIMAGVVASVMAVSTMAVSAFASEPVKAAAAGYKPIPLLGDSVTVPDAVYGADVEVTFNISVNDINGGWANGSAGILCGEEFVAEAKFGGTACDADSNRSWFPVGSIVIADDQKTAEVTCKADLTGKSGFNFYIFSGVEEDNGMFNLESVTIKNAAGFEAKYADGNFEVIAAGNTAPVDTDTEDTTPEDTTSAEDTEATEATEATEETAAPEETTSEETAAPEETTAAAGDTDAPTASDKGAADTGVEGVAVVAGLAVIAAGAVIIAKKRG